MKRQTNRRPTQTTPIYSVHFVLEHKEYKERVLKIGLVLMPNQTEILVP